MTTKLWTPKGGLIVPKPPSYLKLDMAFGIGAGTTLFDESRYRSHGTISGADWADGAHGKCLDFELSDKDYVSIAAAYDQLDFTTEDFSIIARVYLESLTATAIPFIRGSYDADGSELQITSAGSLLIRTNQSTGHQDSHSAAGAIVTGAWYTIGFSRDGASIIPYKNGVDIHSTVGVHQNPDTSARLAYIGAYDGGAALNLDGKIEFLRVFGGIALPASTHLAWHNALA